jgi:methionine-rich copper-binding protein CopC
MQPHSSAARYVPRRARSRFGLLKTSNQRSVQLQVTDASGARVDTGKPQVSGSTMRVGLKSLPPGTYKVHWRALSVDTHTTEGNFSFHVGGP